jgi:hypothetical protein
LTQSAISRSCNCRSLWASGASEAAFWPQRAVLLRDEPAEYGFNLAEVADDFKLPRRDEALWPKRRDTSRSVSSHCRGSAFAMRWATADTKTGAATSVDDREAARPNSPPCAGARAASSTLRAACRRSCSRVWATASSSVEQSDSVSMSALSNWLATSVRQMDPLCGSWEVSSARSFLSRK